MHQSLVETITPRIRLLRSTPIPGFESFVGTYLVTGAQKALVDIGPRVSVPGVLAALAELGIKPEEIDYIVLTHIHIDHGGGAGTALHSMKNARVLAHGRGRAHLIDPARLWVASLETLGEMARLYQQIEPVPEERILTAEDGMKLDLGGGIVLEVLTTPGHAAHHLSLFEPVERVLFAGDAAGIFSNGWLRLTTPPPFRLNDYLASLDRMIALQPRLLCYAHMGGYPDAVLRLGATKAKARLWHSIAQAGAKAGKTAADIALEIRLQDSELEIMDRMSKEDLARDYDLFITSIKGLMTAQ